MTCDYNFLPPDAFSDPLVDPAPLRYGALFPGPLSPDAQLLVDAGNKIKVLSLATGHCHATLQAAAEAHARYQAEHEEQGHQEWEERVKELYAAIPDCDSFAEVCAESWPENTREEAADEMYSSWRQSPGHWGAVNGRCDYWGYAMAQGKNGIWYATGQFGYLRPTSDASV